MPKVDGLRLIRDLIAHDPEVAIIAVSGAAEDLDEAQRFGALAGLMKPVEPQTLIQKVQDVLDNLSGGGGGDMWGSGW